MSKYHCDKCNYKTNRNYDWMKHQETKKHISKVILHKETLQCDCGKLFKHSTSLVRHKNKCKITSTPDSIIVEENSKEEQTAETETEETESHTEKGGTEKITAELLIQLIKQNGELRNMIAQQHIALAEQQNVLAEQQNVLLERQNSITTQQAQIMELCKNTKTVKNNFNLNFFLNVQCKDALNISEFINNLVIKLSDIEYVGRFGYVEGVSRIILDGLKQLDLYKRPIHCTDLKREVLFVKDEDKWDRDENKSKIKNAISSVSQKNCKALCDYIKPCMMMAEHPDCEKNLIIMKNVNGGDYSMREKNHDKIISNISKTVILEPLPNVQ